MGYRTIYTTDNEIDFMHGLYERNRPVFLKYSRQVLADERTWDGEGMNINVNLLKNRLRELLAAHDKETEPTIPALRTAKKAVTIQ